MGVGLVLAAEVAPVRWLRGMTIAQYVASRDPVAGTAYIALLVMMVVLPLLVGRRVAVRG